VRCSRWIAVVGALLCAFPVAGEKSESRELVVNGGFERMKLRLQSSGQYMRDMLDRGWDFGNHPLAEFPDKWYPTTVTGPAKFLVVEGRPGKEVHSGKRCLYVKRLANKGESQVHGQVMGLAGRTYRFSIWARGSGRFVTRCSCQNSLRRSVPCSRPKPGRIDVKLGPSWKRYTVDIRVTSRNVSRFNIALGISGQAWLDDVSLVEVAAAGRSARKSGKD